MKPEPKKPDVRRVLIEQARGLRPNAVGVLLSAGIDSASVLFALLEAGKRVSAYSFFLEGRAPMDCVGARRVAEKFGVPFIAVQLPVDLPTLQRDCVTMARRYGCQRKTQFECFWPMLHAYPRVEEEVVASGMGADGHFCISKKGMLHYRDKIDEFRRGLYRNPDYAQKPQHEKLAGELGKSCWMPYLTDAMRREFLGTTWAEVNKPRQKQPILDAFRDRYRHMKVREHVNLQLGDSGIAEHFTQLLRTPWNQTGAKSVVAIYNRLAVGQIVA